jgi:DNA-binding CsgD family transcriptional regulator/tetratricopeptide (TPR) repeat protein
MAGVIGRESEREALLALIRGRLTGPRTVVLRGDPGIGKTTLWQDLVDQARDSWRVLSVRAVEAEAKLAYGGLTDLVAGFADEVLPMLPAPQRSALDVALLRAEPIGFPTDPRAVGTAVLQTLRHLCGDGQLLIAIDDVQWLDESSADVLRFAARRLHEERIGFLLTRRHTDGEQPANGDIRAGPVTEIALGPLNETELSRLLTGRSQRPLPRRAVKQIIAVSGGNPFYALELAASLERHPSSLDFDDSISVPSSLREVISGRLDELTGPERETLLAAAISAAPTVAILATAVGADAGRLLAGPARAGVVELHGDEVHFVHPLFASVVGSDAPRETRVELHRALAAAVGDPEQRARHLALAAGTGRAGHDADIADEVERGAVHASARGAVGAAADLLERAAAFSVDDAARGRRLIAAAKHRILTIEPQRADALAREAETLLTDDAARAEAILTRATANLHNVHVGVSLLDAALATGASPAMRAQALALRAVLRATLLLDPHAGLLDARAALEAAHETQIPELLGLADGARAWAEVMSGQAPSPALDAPARPFFAAARPLLARKVWRGELRAPREQLLELQRAAADDGDEESYAALSLHICELELRAGDLDAAAERAQEVADYAAYVPSVGAAASWLAATIAARRGDLAKTRREVERTVSDSQAAGHELFVLLARGEEAHALLATGNAGDAAEILVPLFERIVERGLNEPGEFPFVPDLVEAHVMLDRIGDAERALDWLEARAREQDHPWAAGTAARCRGLVLAAGGDHDAALSELARSIDQLERLGLQFEAARTRLALGNVLRRARKRGDAREELLRAAALFDGLGSVAWAQRARDEHGRVGGRRPTGNELTSMQRRVAELAAEGRSHREIAGVLFVSENTVESHLKRVFAKLGIRSRTELAHRVGER